VKNQVFALYTNVSLVLYRHELHCLLFFAACNESDCYMNSKHFDLLSTDTHIYRIFQGKYSTTNHRLVRTCVKCCPQRNDPKIVKNSQSHKHQPVINEIWIRPIRFPPDSSSKQLRSKRPVVKTRRMQLWFGSRPIAIFIIWNAWSS